MGRRALRSPPPPWSWPSSVPVGLSGAETWRGPQRSTARASSSLPPPHRGTSCAFDIHVARWGLSVVCVGERGEEEEEEEGRWRREEGGGGEEVVWFVEFVKFVVFVVFVVIMCFCVFLGVFVFWGGRGERVVLVFCCFGVLVVWVGFGGFWWVLVGLGGFGGFVFGC